MGGDRGTDLKWEDRRPLQFQAATTDEQGRYRLDSLQAKPMSIWIDSTRLYARRLTDVATRAGTTTQAEPIEATKGILTKIQLVRTRTASRCDLNKCNMRWQYPSAGRVGHRNPDRWKWRQTARRSQP